MEERKYLVVEEVVDLVIQIGLKIRNLRVQMVLHLILVHLMVKNKLIKDNFLVK